MVLSTGGILPIGDGSFSYMVLYGITICFDDVCFLI